MFIDFPFFLITSFRNKLYDWGLLASYSSKIPVICVGNISVGGNGKTPLVEYLIETLLGLGRKPVVLSRGYGGSLPGPVVINETHSVSEVGDEPTMLFNKHLCPIVVAKKRVLGAHLIEAQQLGDVIILDDGLQHRALNRDLNIICAYLGDEKSRKSYKAGKLLPVGRFRENKQQAYKRTQAFVMNSRSSQEIDLAEVRDILAEIPKHVEVFSTSNQIGRIASKSDTKYSSAEQLEVDVFCAIANPEGFLKSIEDFGGKVKNKYLLSDHAEFKTDFLNDIVSRSEGRPLVCSAKDYVKINPEKCPQVYCAYSMLKLKDSDRFVQMIKSALK